MWKSIAVEESTMVFLLTGFSNCNGYPVIKTPQHQYILITSLLYIFTFCNADLLFSIFPHMEKAVNLERVFTERCQHQF